MYLSARVSAAFWPAAFLSSSDLPAEIAPPFLPASDWAEVPTVKGPSLRVCRTGGSYSIEI